MPRRTRLRRKEPGQAAEEVDATNMVNTCLFFGILAVEIYASKLCQSVEISDKSLVFVRKIDLTKKSEINTFICWTGVTS